MLHLCLLYVGKFKFLHKGHCGGSGYVSPNTNQESIDDCRKECESRADVKYFAYKSGNVCKCYTTECTPDGQNLDYMAFEILESGKTILKQYLHRISRIYSISNHFGFQFVGMIYDMTSIIE